MHSFTQSLMDLVTCAVINSLINLLCQSFVHALVHPFIYSLLRLYNGASTWYLNKWYRLVLINTSHWRIWCCVSRFEYDIARRRAIRFNDASTHYWSECTWNGHAKTCLLCFFVVAQLYCRVCAPTRYLTQQRVDAQFDRTARQRRAWPNKFEYKHQTP